MTTSNEIKLELIKAILEERPIIYKTEMVLDEVIDYGNQKAIVTECSFKYSDRLSKECIDGSLIPIK